MTSRIIFIATFAGLAIMAPAQAQRPDRAEREQQRAERQQRTEQTQARQARAERPQRQERQQARGDRPQRHERAQVERPQRQERVRLERPRQQDRVRVEAPERRQLRMERPQGQERASVQRAQREDRVRFERPQREQRVSAERVRNEQRVRTQRAERVRPDRVQVEQRGQRGQVNREQRGQIKQVQREGVSQREALRSARQNIQAQRTDRVIDRQAQRFERQAERQAQRSALQKQRFEGRLDRQQPRNQQQKAYRAVKPQYSVGSRYSAASSNRDWYDQVAAQRYKASTASSEYFYDYDYDDGYLYQLRRGSNIVSAAYPLLGGAFAVGQLLPTGFDSYNVPYGYRSLYYDTPDYSYRYGDGAIYRVDPTTQLVSAIVALLSAQRFGVGQMLPMGFDAYNVPYAYRDEYYDRSDAWYRYDDGYIYQVDPYSRMIVGMVPVSYGGAYSVGYPAPAYAHYGGYGAYAGYPSYQVPFAYDNLYYDAPGYDYHLAGGGIYQVDPITQIVSALVGLVTMTNFSVGQPLPLGYDTYNVPTQYRASYYDRPDAWYRYDDGHIYEVDPQTRIIQAAIPLSYDGYMIGQPIPAGYPAYPVPEYYEDLYFASPDYDYRYYDGGIYQIDRDSQIVIALAALVTGNDVAVGGMLPVGYDAYNLPYAYRDQYHDDGEYLYRYRDGRIYQIDPQTRLIRSIIDAVA